MGHQFTVSQSPKTILVHKGRTIVQTNDHRQRIFVLELISSLGSPSYKSSVLLKIRRHGKPKKV